MAAKLRVAGICFEHFHMGDNLRAVVDHPDVELVGISDEKPERMQEAIANFGIQPDRVFTDDRACLEQTQPDVVIACPAAAGHGMWTERIMSFGADAIIEKPMAASLAEADQMIAAAEASGRRLMINWPSAWSAPHLTTHRMIQDGLIGEVIEVHYYGGNRGPLYHGADKRETTPEEIAREKPHSWFYKKAAGGGSLLDYIGYGTTLGTWFFGGRAPLEVTAVVDQPAGLEVDEHAVAVARYETGLSKFETRWGTFTDPWTEQPQPKCGFVVVGTEGTIGCYDYQNEVRVQTRSQTAIHSVANDPVPPTHQNLVTYFVHCVQNNLPIEGPCSPQISRIGQQIVDTAIESTRQKRTLPLLP